MGQKAYRLCLPDVDMSLQTNIDEVIQKIQDERQRGRQVLIWVSLPCTCWCQWQFVNKAIAEQNGAEALDAFQTNLNKERNESRVLLDGFVKVLIAATKLGAFVAFEWTAYNTGWHEPKMQTVMQLLPYVALVDGCQLGMQDPEGSQ